MITKHSPSFWRKVGNLISVFGGFLNINTSNGNVGIGTSSPTYKVDVKGLTTTSAVSSDMGFNVYQVPKPDALSGVVSAGGSVDTGLHGYYITYTTALGETSAYGPLQITTTAGNNTVTLTIPVSSDPRVTGRKIYRTKAGTIYNEYLLATIGNNTATTHIDTVADSALTTGYMTAYYRTNNTSPQFTLNGQRIMLVDSNGLYLGTNAGIQVTSGGYNTFIGTSSGLNNTSALSNTFIGYLSGGQTTTGGSNTYIGTTVAYANTTGFNNVAIGFNTGRYHADGSTGLTTANNCVYIGHRVLGFNNSDTNSIVIGSNAVGIGSNAVVLGNTSITTTVLRGNVGIGTTTPSYSLDIKGTSATSGASTQAGYNIETVSAPPAPTFTLSSGGSVDTGNHNYRITYTTAIGETSMGGILTATVTAGNNTVNLTIPTSTDPRVTGRKIYRNKIGQTSDVGYLLATINNNTTTTYTDTAADSTLTGDNWSPYRVNTTSKYWMVNGVRSILTDPQSTFIGYNAGASAISAGLSTFIGSGAGFSTTTGFDNTFVGTSAGNSNTTGGINLGVGRLSLFRNTTGNSNVGIGEAAISGNQTGSNNTALGANVMEIAVGANVNHNVAIGCRAASLLANGATGNIHIGSLSAAQSNNRLQNPNANYSIVLGYGSYSRYSNQTQIGDLRYQNRCDIAGDTYVRRANVLGVETLTNGALTSGTSWSATGDVTLVNNRAEFVFNTGALSTLTQAQANLVTPIKPNTWYQLSWHSSNVTGSPSFNLTTSLSSIAENISASYGDVLYFKTSSSPTDFFITSTLTSGQAFNLDNLSLKEVRGGNIEACGFVNGKKVGVFASLDAPANTTITTAGTYYAIAGTFTNSPVEGFGAATTYTPGIKYTETLTQHFEIDWHATVEGDQVNTDVTVGIKKNGTIIPSSVMKTRCFSASAPYTLSGTCVVELAQNDEIQLVVTSDGNGDVITFDNFTTTINEFFD